MAWRTCYSWWNNSWTCCLFYIIVIKIKYSNLKFLDIVVVGLILAQAIGRWGNFFNQEAYGAITTKQELINMHIPTFIINGMYIDGNYYQPTFLYESILDLLGFVILFLIRLLSIS